MAGEHSEHWEPIRKLLATPVRDGESVGHSDNCRGARKGHGLEVIFIDLNSHTLACGTVQRSPAYRLSKVLDWATKHKGGLEAGGSPELLR